MPAKRRTDQLVTWVYAEDLERTCEFYGRTLGLELFRDEGPARIFQASPGGLIGVCQAEACQAAGWRVVEPKGSMISIVTDDVDDWFDRLTREGATIKSEPRLLPQFGVYAFWIEDPNGYLIEFQQFVDEGRP